MNSQLPELHKKTVAQRLDAIAKEANLTEEEKALLQKFGGLDEATANRMIENVYSTMPLPLGMATNFVINGKDYLIPFALEEPSVVAAASNAAKLCRPHGFTASTTEPVMIGQIQLTDIQDVEKARKAVLDNKAKIIEECNKQDPMLVSRGGGVKDVDPRIIETTRGKMLIVHLLVNVQDAMGANAINTMAEYITPFLEQITKGVRRLRIISNLAIYRTAYAKTVWTKEALEESTKGEMNGDEIVERMLDAYAFATADPFRASTHNKGIMNGIDAVVIATGNDFRAIEAGAHSYAWFKSKPHYSTLTKYSKNEDGDLVGEIELPVAVGLVGGATRTHPIARINLKILDIKNAAELGQVLASVGLAQNFAAMRAMVTTGIQAGHMKLHAKNIAVIGGATGEMIDKVAKQMIAEKNIKADRAKQIVEELSK